jgi:hypothetical protein
MSSIFKAIKMLLPIFSRVSNPVVMVKVASLASKAYDVLKTIPKDETT